MKKFQLRVACLTVLLLATITRFYRLDHQSLWADEGNSLSLWPGPALEKLQLGLLLISTPPFTIGS